MLGGYSRGGYRPKTVPRGYTALLAALYLGGCALVPAPQTFNQGWAYAEALHTTILTAAGDAVSAGKLGSVDAEAILAAADQAQAILLTAQALNATGDSAGAQANLTTATGILTALQPKIPVAKP